jgi:hypothetical protein
MKPGQLRRTMVVGIAFIVLLVAGALLMFSGTPETKSSESAAEQAHKWVAELSSSGNRTAIIVGAYVLIVGGLAWVWFTLGLRAWLAPGPLVGRAITSLGVLGAGALFASAMAGASVAGAVAFGNEHVPQDGDVIRIAMGLLFPFLFVVFALVSGALIVLLSVVGRRSGVLPRWLGWAAVLGVLGAVIGVVGIPYLVTLLWFLALCIVGLVRSSPPSTAPQAAPVET